MTLRSKILVASHKLFQFSLKGDLQLEEINSVIKVSCIINFFGRPDLLEGILYSLSEQDLPKEFFEVILIEDRGGTGEGQSIVKKFSSLLNVRYFALQANYGKMGFSRNYGISKAQGKYVLLLDDDTVILQKNFLSTLIDEFESTGSDAIVPFGSAAYGLIRGRYDFHDPYFPTSRCMAYKREVLKELGGFVSEIVGQEDVEFVVRFVASGKSFLNSDQLSYLHPPLIVRSLEKPAAVGLSFAKLRKRYPLIIWIMLLLNGSRYLPLILFPLKAKWKMQGRFSLGFVLGIFYAAFRRSVIYNDAKS